MTDLKGNSLKEILLRGTMLSQEYLDGRHPLFAAFSREFPLKGSGKQNVEDVHFGDVSPPTGAIRFLAHGGEPHAAFVSVFLLNTVTQKIK